MCPVYQYCVSISHLRLRESGMSLRFANVGFRLRSGVVVSDDKVVSARCQDTRVLAFVAGSVVRCFRCELHTQVDENGQELFLW
jgi:hypothetical protein